MDSVIATVDKALSKQGMSTKAVERWKAEMPNEQEMVPKDKYTIFDRKAKGYRKGIHSTLNSTSSPLSQPVESGQDGRDDASELVLI